MVQVGYDTNDHYQHLTLTRKDIDLDAVGTDQLIKSEKVTQFTYDYAYCFNQLATKGEIVVLLCEQESSIKILGFRDLDEEINLFEYGDIKLSDMTIIMHAPNAYQIYFRLED